MESNAIVVKAPPGSVSFESEEELPDPEGYLDSDTFLKRLKELFEISSIYYPGCGRDNGLESVFDPVQIVYVDRDTEIGNSANIFANYNVSPFQDEVFDALFCRDNHAEPEGIEEMLRTVEPYGIVIFEDVPCLLNLSVRQFEEIPGIHSLDLPFYHRYFRVFIKD